MINFSAGPAALPRSAIERAREDLVDFEHSGLSVVEQSHRAAPYERIHRATLGALRELLAVPQTHEILLLPGGARGQFAMLPLGLLRPGKVGEYVLTGHWARMAYDEGRLLGDTRIVADTREPDGSYRRIPKCSELDSRPDAAFLHLCSNNTLFGTQWSDFPEPGEVPLVADMTSDLLSRSIDFQRFGVIYAGAQKNLGPPGVVAVIIRRALFEVLRQDIPKIWRYPVHAEAASLYCTPATSVIATMYHVLQYALSIGGVPALETANREKARRLYAALDRRPELYRMPAEVASRSLMNVVFRLPSKEVEARFLAEATRRDMVGLEGHAAVGGLRASIYNWVSLDDVDALVELVDDFQP